jgi:hypothetical protein
VIQRKKPTADAPEEGVPLVLGGAEYLVPSIYIGPLRRLTKKLNAARAAADEDTIAEVSCEIIHAALRINYPEVTLDDVQDRMVKASTVQKVLEVVLGQSGLATVLPGEGAEMGEAAGPS